MCDNIGKSLYGSKSVYDQYDNNENNTESDANNKNQGDDELMIDYNVGVNLKRYKSSNLFKDRTDARYLAIVFMRKKGYWIEKLSYTIIFFSKPLLRINFFPIFAAILVSVIIDTD